MGRIWSKFTRLPLSWRIFVTALMAFSVGLMFSGCLLSAWLMTSHSRGTHWAAAPARPSGPARCWIRSFSVRWAFLQPLHDISKTEKICNMIKMNIFVIWTNLSSVGWIFFTFWGCYMSLLFRTVEVVFKGLKYWNTFEISSSDDYCYFQF